MKTVGLLGGTGWSSTIDYYKLLNEGINQKRGGYHSCKISLNSIDYQDIMTSYGKNESKVCECLESELLKLMTFNPDCILICCNSLHKFLDIISHKLPNTIPFIHAIEETAKALQDHGHKKTLLLATQFTMEDGFFEKALQNNGINVTIPNPIEREAITVAHNELMQNIVSEQTRSLFISLANKYKECGSITLGCTEFPLALKQEDTKLPIFNPVQIQCQAAINFALA